MSIKSYKYKILSAPPTLQNFKNCLKKSLPNHCASAGRSLSPSAYESFSKQKKYESIH